MKDYYTAIKELEDSLGYLTTALSADLAGAQHIPFIGSLENALDKLVHTGIFLAGLDESFGSTEAIKHFREGNRVIRAVDSELRDLVYQLEETSHWDLSENARSCIEEAINLALSVADYPHDKDGTNEG